MAANENAGVQDQLCTLDVLLAYKVGHPSLNSSSKTLLQVLNLSPHPCVLVMLALALHSSRCELAVLDYSFHLANLPVGSFRF